MNVGIGITNIIVVVFITGMTLSGLAKNGSLITSGFLSLYITFLTYSGLSSYPDGKCNMLINSDKSMVF